MSVHRRASVTVGVREVAPTAADLDQISSQYLDEPKAWSGHEFLYAFGSPHPWSSSKRLTSPTSRLPRPLADRPAPRTVRTKSVHR